VTGVSTGALIAPFAFLGKEYDDHLAALYLTGKAQSLIDVNWKSAGVFGTSILTGNALREMVRQEVSPELVALMAAEHRKGRRLLIMTTNLDTQRAIVWNIGAIANSQRPDAVTLIRDVLTASASIPGVFPAVKIKTRAGSRIIEELHSDGGSSSQLFSLPEHAMANPQKVKGAKKLHIHVIVNNALIPEFAMTSNSTLSVAGRAYAVLVKSQTKQSLLALYNYALRSDVEFRYAAISQAVPYSMLDPFNKDYMNAVYKLGYEGTLNGKIWLQTPSFQSPANQKTVSGVPLSAVD
jgi:predicted acylesterase/phospholipase RssA